MPRRTIGNRRSGDRYGFVGVEPIPDDATSKFFVSAKGRKAGAWIDNSRPNPYNEGDMLESPAFQIESILRDELSLANINTASFDEADNMITQGFGHKTAFSWNQQQSVFSKISDISRESGFAFFVDHAGNFKLKAVQGALFTGHNFRLVEDDLLGNDNLKVYRTATDQIYNEVVVNYAFSYMRNTYEQSIESTTTAHTVGPIPRDLFRDGYTSYLTMVTASRTKYNVTRRLVVDAPYTRTLAGAERIFARACDWHALHRYVVEADLPLKKLESDPNKTTADIEIGDFCLVNHSLLPLTTSGIVGTPGLSDSAIFIVTRAIFNPRELTYHLTLRETPYRGLPTEPEIVNSGGDAFGEGYGNEPYGQDTTGQSL